MKKEDTLYKNFYTKWEEVTDVTPQTLGPFTPFYKWGIPFFKSAPWRVLVPVAVLLISFVMLFTRLTSFGLTSILQRAF